jgi:hypothetical protein
MVTAMGTLNCKERGRAIFCCLFQTRARQYYHGEQNFIPAGLEYRYQDNVSSYVQEWHIEIIRILGGGVSSHSVYMLIEST